MLFQEDMECKKNVLQGEQIKEVLLLLIGKERLYEK